MRHTAHRLLRLIALLQARRHWSGAELAERMGVDRRSIRRDVERLRELGYPVHASAGVGGGYRLGAAAPVLPILLDEEEATTLAIALRAASATVAGIDDTARGLLSKLDPLVPAGRRQQAGEALEDTASVQQEFEKKNNNFAASVDKVKNAVINLTVNTDLQDFLSGALSGVASLINALALLPRILAENKTEFVALALAIVAGLLGAPWPLVWMQPPLAMLLASLGTSIANIALPALKTSKTRVDCEITIAGYGAGKLALVMT